MKKILQKICSMMILLLSIVTTSCSTLPKVTLIEDVETYTMDNGIITARISKAVSYTHLDVYKRQLPPYKAMPRKE